MMGDEFSLYWQWWPVDTTHLLNVATQLCLTSAFPSYDVIKRGYSNITVEQCVLGNKRQVSVSLPSFIGKISTYIIY